MRAIKAQDPWIEEAFPRFPQRLPKDIFDLNLDPLLHVAPHTRVTLSLFGCGNYLAIDPHLWRCGYQALGAPGRWGKIGRAIRPRVNQDLPGTKAPGILAGKPIGRQ